jgi:hypothetical protein
VLKGALLGGLALVSWGVHALNPPECPTVVAIVGNPTEGESAPVIALTVCTDAKSSRTPWIRLGAIVPPIRVETLYTPDVLHPALVTGPTPPAEHSS